MASVSEMSEENFLLRICSECVKMSDTYFGKRQQLYNIAFFGDFMIVTVNDVGDTICEESVLKNSKFLSI